MYYSASNTFLNTRKGFNEEVIWSSYLSYPGILVKSNSNELWTSLKLSPELCSNREVVTCYFTIIDILCISQFLYSGSFNSEYNKLLVLHCYFIFFTDFICWLFSSLSFPLFAYISINTSDLSCRYFSSNTKLVPPSTFILLRTSLILPPTSILKSWNKSLKGAQHISWSQSSFQHLVGPGLTSRVPGVTFDIFPHLTLPNQPFLD